MAKIKYTKTEQKKQQDALKQFQRFLPTLQLKKQQLQQEVRSVREKLDRNRERQRETAEQLSGLMIFFSDSNTIEALEDLVCLTGIVSSAANIAGINIPVFEKAEFADKKWNLLATPWHLDDCVLALKTILALRAEGSILEQQYALLLSELVSTGQRVNLFEKVKIPECRNNIRRIRIQLGDQETSAVARSKIVKKKQMSAGD